MAIAFSGSTIVYRDDLDGSTPANLVAHLEGALTLAGWPSEPITGGRIYQLVSPQGLACRCKIWDPGTYEFGIVYASVQFLSDDESRLGFRHVLGCEPGRVYQIVANICQMFVSVPGRDTNITTNGACVAGGVPFTGEAMPPTGDCRQEVREDGPINEIWWSCGDREISSGAARPNFRNGYKTFLAWSACYRGDLIKETPDQNFNALRIFPVTHCYDIDLWFGNPPEVRYLGGLPLYLDPLIGWGSGEDLSVPARARAQIWDAVYASVDHPLDEVLTLDDLTYINYSHSENNGAGQGTHFGSLLLLTTAPTPPPESGNFVY